MSGLAFDTLAYVKRLRDAGVEPAHTEAQAEALSIAIKDNVVTSSELQDLRSGLETKIDQLEVQLESRITEVQLVLRTEIRESQVTMIKWLVPLLIGQAALIAALVKLF